MSILSILVMSELEWFPSLWINVKEHFAQLQTEATSLIFKLWTRC